MRRTMLLTTLCFSLISLGHPSNAEDWTRFRGPNGTGVSTSSAPTPVKWGPGENIKWKAELPGRGSSSPIIVGDRIFVTYWSGYGLDRQNPGNQEDLKLHLICFNRADGEKNWTASIDPYLPEDRFGGMFSQHGYASHTPVSDGEHVYAFFGKTGAAAFTMDGDQVWLTQIGIESDSRGWGSASSPILFEDLLIVTATAESEAMVGLDKKTGKEVWRQEATGFGSTWGTPILVSVGNDRTDLVIGVPNEIWGMNPRTGRLRWFCPAMATDSFCSSVFGADGVIYAIEGRGGGSIAVRAGGKGDVGTSHVVWQGRDNNRIGTPVLHDGLIYTFSNRIANCIDASDGSEVFKGRLTGGTAAGGTGGGGGRRRGGGSGGGGGFGRGGFGNQDYSSSVAADGKLYFTSRVGEIYVLKLGRTFEQLAVNKVTVDSEDFSATPAISDGELYIRSSHHLYCVAGSK